MMPIVEENKNLHWMYKEPNSMVNREEYLLGRQVDKTLEQLNAKESGKSLVLPTPGNHVEYECIPPSIRDFNKIVANEQVDITAKLQEDPLVAIKKREEEARRQFLQNPVQLKKLEKALNQRKRSQSGSTSDEDSDDEIEQKLALLKNYDGSINNLTRKPVKDKESSLDIILIHKYHQLKHKLTEDDLREVLASDSEDEHTARKKKKKSKSKKDDRKKKSKKDVRKKSKSKQHDSSDDSVKDKKRSRGKYKSKKHQSSSESSDDEHEKKKFVKKNKSKSRITSEKIKHKKRVRRFSSSESESSSDDCDYRRKSRRSDTKHKKRERNSSSSSESESSSDDRKKKYRKRVRSSSRSSESESSCDDKKKSKRKDLKYKKRARYSSSSSESECNSYDGKRSKKSNTEIRHGRNRSKSRNPDNKETKQFYVRKEYDSDGNEMPLKPQWGLVNSDGSKIEVNKTATNYIKNEKKKEEETSKPILKYTAKKLSEEVKEILRLEMMQNAQWRDKERIENVRKYRENDQKEEDNHREQFKKYFLHKELLKSVNTATVEGRIKSNLNNIQRSSTHMESHFSRR